MFLEKFQRQECALDPKGRDLGFGAKEMSQMGLRNKECELKIQQWVDRIWVVMCVMREVPRKIL